MSPARASRGPRIGGRGGFTLVEALVALTIAGALAVMVGTMFLVQNEFYSWIALRAEVQENARAMSDLISSEIRSVPLGGVLIADSQRVVIRAPMVSASPCGYDVMSGGAIISVYVPGGANAIDQAEVASLGRLNGSTGAWTFWDTSWGSLSSSGGSPAADCAVQGADTTGATANFVRIRYYNVTGSYPAAGDVLMIGRKVEYRIQSSLLEPTVKALFRGNYGSTLSEFATGLGPTAHFEYRYGSNTYYKVVTGSNRALIDGIRIVAQSTGRGESGAKSTYDFGWTLDVPLANAR